ncbi:unnamed protein product [Heligmosomoides polygyrus]|uniref:Endo/exonuclease/phosphatase domain-containing protein n=1 Tax=Heligmosomoides polygyrus TaxID=6339 RepID=A0A183GSK5_HELPZ|nr:unnamed protein product [Heligmosomoides polygyrus]
MLRRLVLRSSHEFWGLLDQKTAEVPSRDAIVAAGDLNTWTLRKTGTDVTVDPVMGRVTLMVLLSMRIRITSP